MTEKNIINQIYDPDICPVKRPYIAFALPGAAPNKLVPGGQNTVQVQIHELNHNFHEWESVPDGTKWKYSELTKVYEPRHFYRICRWCNLVRKVELNTERAV